MRSSDLALRLPDTPRWVETRFMLLRDEAVVTGLVNGGASFVARSTRWPLVAVVGRPEPDAIRAAASEAGDTATVLTSEEGAAHVGTALPGWTVGGADIHAWPADRPLPGPQDDVRLLTPSEVRELPGVPTDLHAELTLAAEYSPVSAAFAAGRPGAFCYATAITESLWDISIDTLEPFRRRGLAAGAARHLIHVFSGDGRAPVWGAADDNEPSRSLARKLGFVPAERLALFLGPAA